VLRAGHRCGRLEGGGQAGARGSVMELSSRANLLPVCPDMANSCARRPAGGSPGDSAGDPVHIGCNCAGCCGG
jgi:hypothetical protein